MNETELRNLANRHRAPGLLLDANLLLVWVIGSVDPGLVRNFRRTRNNYEPTDYDLLAFFVRAFPQLLITPNVLTEVSNLLGHPGGPLQQKVFQSMQGLIPGFDERYIESRLATQERCFPSLGLSDAVLLSFAREGALVLTDDGPLYGWLLSEKLPCCTLNQLWDMATG